MGGGISPDIEEAERNGRCGKRPYPPQHVDHELTLPTHSEHIDIDAERLKHPMPTNIKDCNVENGLAKDEGIHAGKCRVLSSGLNEGVVGLTFSRDHVCNLECFGSYVNIYGEAIFPLQLI